MPFTVLKTLPPPERITTVAEVAEYLGVAESRVRAIAAEGRIPSRKRKGARIFDFNDVLDYRNTPKAPRAARKPKAQAPAAEDRRAAFQAHEKEVMNRPGGYTDLQRKILQRKQQIDSLIYQVPKAGFCICEHDASRHDGFAKYPNHALGPCDIRRCECNGFHDSVADALERESLGLPPRLTVKEGHRRWDAKQKAQEAARIAASDERTAAILKAQIPDLNGDGGDSDSD